MSEGAASASVPFDFAQDRLLAEAHKLSYNRADPLEKEREIMKEPCEGWIAPLGL
jgi:hypothetical protein